MQRSAACVHLMMPILAYLFTCVVCNNCILPAGRLWPQMPWLVWRTGRSPVVDRFSTWADTTRIPATISKGSEAPSPSCRAEIRWWRRCERARSSIKYNVGKAHRVRTSYHNQSRKNDDEKWPAWHKEEPEARADLLLLPSVGHPSRRCSQKRPLLVGGYTEKLSGRTRYFPWSC